MVLGGSELAEGSGVNLLTVHASKGPRFDEVLCDRLNGIGKNFPKIRNLGMEVRRLGNSLERRKKEDLFP